MKLILRSCCLLALAGMLAAPLSAADDDAGAKRKKRGGRPQGRLGARAMFRLPPSIALSEEQQARLDELTKEYSPKMRELFTKSMAVVTDEQKKARGEAFRAAREAGKKGKELREAVDAALSLTDEQKKTQQDLRAEMRKLMDEARGKLNEILTADQREQLKKARESRRPRRGEGAPKKPKKPAAEAS